MKIKRILIRVSAAAVVIAIVSIALWASHQPKNAPCARLEVEIIDSLDRRFVESKELRQLLYREGLLPVGKQMNEVSDKDIDIIGQFGVGFYSAFMVADEITVVSKSIDSDEAFRWNSKGLEGYTIEETQKNNVGTDVIIHVKEDTEDEEQLQFDF